MTLELFGFRQLAWEDETVKTGRVDNGHFLRSGGGLHFGAPSIVGVNALPHCVCRSFISEYLRYIFADKIRFIIYADSSTTVLVVELFVTL